MLSWFGRALVALLVGGTIAVSQAHLPDDPVADENGQMLPSPLGADLMAVGFETLLAEYYWLRAVQIAGSDGGPVGRSREIGDLIGLVTSLDPWVDHPYRFAALWMTDDLSAIRAANALLERGIAHHPDEWRNRFHLGFNHFFYLGDQATAARILEPAIDLPNSPVYLGRLVARLKGSEGGLEVAAAFLHTMAEQTSDPARREAYLGSLKEVETERRARFLDEARARYVERHGRDIGRVEDLLAGAAPILRDLPPDPLEGQWVLGDVGQIVSSAAGRRYRLHIDATNQMAIQRIREASDLEASKREVGE